MSAQPVMPSIGTMASTGTPLALSVLTWYGQVVPTARGAIGEVVDLGAERGPVLAHERVLRLEQLDGRVELRLGQLVDIGDAQLRLWDLRYSAASAM